MTTNLIIVQLVIFFPLLSSAQFVSTSVSDSIDSSLLKRPGNIQVSFHQQEKPPLYYDRLINEVLMGMASGVALGAVLQFIRNLPDNFIIGPSTSIINYNSKLQDITSVQNYTNIDNIPNNVNLDRKSKFERYFPFYLGMIIGSTAAVNKIGNLDNETGSLLWTITGSTLMVFGGLYMGDWGSILGPPIGAMIAFNLTRKFDFENGSSMIEVNDDKVSISFPKLDVDYIQNQTSGDWLLRTNILKINF